jgi:hypothetical protein
MADEKKNTCRYCGHIRDSHETVPKQNRPNFKMKRKDAIGKGETYRYSFRNCPGFLELPSVDSKKIS